jgi:CRISPR/Cas system CSM-associated protein Csm5 (group 7 of RAMP superfamily)
MDDLLKNALEFSNYRQTLSTQKKVLKEKLEAKLTIGYGGGLFKVDRSLISFVDFLIKKERTENVVLLDQNSNPVMVSDLFEFETTVLDVYFSATTEYHIEFEKIKTNRSVESLVDL